MKLAYPTYAADGLVRVFSICCSSGRAGAGGGRKMHCVGGGELCAVRFVLWFNGPVVRCLRPHTRR